MIVKIKNFVKRHIKLYRIAISILNKFSNNSVKKRANKVTFCFCRVKRSRIRIYGKNNTVLLKSGTIKNIEICIRGNNNHVELGERVSIEMIRIFIEDDNNSILVGNDIRIYGSVHLAAMEGTSIVVGNGCMFSENVLIRTGDAHSIIKDGKRINRSKSVYIGEHVWIGADSKLLKGSFIADNSIIGVGSIVNKEFKVANVIIAGVPATIVKRDVSWLRDRVKLDQTAGLDC